MTELEKVVRKYLDDLYVECLRSGCTIQSAVNLAASNTDCRVLDITMEWRNEKEPD